MPTVETVLNNPLNGEEVREIILIKIHDALLADCRLADYIAVPNFRFRADIAIILNGAVQNEVAVTVEAGTKSLVDESTASAITAHVQQEEMPPNIARVDAGLGVPVLTSDEKGRPVERTVKYDKTKIKSRSQEKAATVPSGIPGVGTGSGTPKPDRDGIPTVNMPVPK